jgi:uncharacterized protein
VKTLRLIITEDRLAVCRLPTRAVVPPWSEGPGLFALVRDADALSVVCAEDRVPVDVRREGGWRALRLEGPFAFTETGILAAALAPLAEAEVGIFALSTFDTDYVLVKEAQLARAVRVLREAGHQVG